jgi:deazaflavin-dependent oxidoreductase (nitroreductase family)
MTGNRFMSWILRSPFHGVLSKGMMLITVTGRKSGKKYTTPVGFYRNGECLWILTSRDRTWWRNLQGGAGVELFLQRKTMNGFGELELNDAEVQKRLVEYIHEVPQAARSLRIRMEDGKLNGEDVARVAKDRLFVKIKLS